MEKPQNIMKKALILGLGLAFFVGCSPDAVTTSEIESVDLTKIINPDTVRASAKFDNSSSGIYKGVFVSTDMSYHGVLTVNLANDSQYNAILEYGNNERIGFVRVNNGQESISDVIEFRGENTGFTINVSDYKKPVVTEGYVDGQQAQIKLLKETSTNPVMVDLGTFSDDIDLTFQGTWNFVSNSTQVVNVPTGLVFPATIPVTVNIISQVVVTKDGAMFTDNVMEDFTPGPGCQVTLPAGSQAPFFSGVQNISGFNIDEYAAAAQTSTFVVGLNTTWSLIHSFYQGDKYYDINCIETPAGGTWSMGSRNGHILLN